MNMNGKWTRALALLLALLTLAAPALAEGCLLYTSRCV